MLEEWRHEEAIIYSDYVEKTTVHDPEELLADYQQQQTEIQNLRDQLKDILANALAGDK